jgi:hypothetical protein
MIRLIFSYRESCFMKNIATALGIAALAGSMSLAAAAQDNSPNLSLVQANATLDKKIDVKTVKQGDAVTAKLTGKVRFANGTELPRGTELVGHVDQVSDANGTPTLAWTFDKAQLKDGKEVPLKATLLGIYRPGQQQGDTSLTLSANTQVDQQAGDLPFSLHSAVADNGSGTLTGTHKDLKLNQGTQLQFAVAAQPGAGASTGGN